MTGPRAPAHGVTAVPLPPALPPQQQLTDANDKDGDVQLFRLNALQTLGDWSVHDDGDGRLFYYNSASAQSQWDAPAAFTGLEGELMMKLMLQHAVARSGFWSAHDAGNGTLYYFNERTRASVWERPEEWGILPPPPPLAPPPQENECKGDSTADECAPGNAEAVLKKPKKEKKKPKKVKQSTNTNEEDGNAEEANEPAEHEELPPPPLSAEEIEAVQQRDAAERKRIESFRQMLRDKKVMPFTKWSVAMPRIISDPRFMAIPTYVFHVTYRSCCIVLVMALFQVTNSGFNGNCGCI